MNVMEVGFRQGEESWLTPREYDDELICDRCGEIIEKGKGNLCYEKDEHFLCEVCAKEAAIEALYDEMEEV